MSVLVSVDDIKMLRHGQRPTEPVSFGDAAGHQAAPADLQQLKALALAAANAKTVSEQGAALAAFEHAMSLTSPAVVLDLIARIERGEHAFKNFHCSLCARFDYTHDERDWKRDQVSLEEHIAASIERAPAPTTSRGLTLGVGDGSGKLFVHGDYDSIKAVQAIIFENERLRAAARATASGDELPVERVVELAEESEFEYPECSGRMDFDRVGFARSVEREVRAAVSAATKPTALDLSEIPVAWYVKEVHPGWPEFNKIDEFSGGYTGGEKLVRLADVQSLLATKPAQES